MGFASPVIKLGITRRFLGSVLAIVCLAGTYSYGETSANEGAQVEYISPDGKFSSLSAANPTARQSAAAFVDGNTVSCVLKEGETTFIIELPTAATSDRFT